MKILIYKRTHKGDPDERGIFGIHDCMGRVRNWEYDAVIGIGGKAPWNKDKDIKYRINWVGITPKRVKLPEKRGDCIVFSHFELFEEKGKNIKSNYPNLYSYMYESGKRFDMSFPNDVLLEIEEILESVQDSPPSKSYDIVDESFNKKEELNHSTKCIGCYTVKKRKLIIDINERC